MKKREAFTLIELLVVISILVLLMALLLPALSRVRRQARAVACQARLRQAGLGMAVVVENNDGRLPKASKWGDEEIRRIAAVGLFFLYPPFTESPELAVCPSATKPIGGGDGDTRGDTFAAYHITIFEGFTGSYGQNRYARRTNNETAEKRLDALMTSRGASSVPYLLDSVGNMTAMSPGQGPPDCESWLHGANTRLLNSCINRHQGGVNALFMDWSVRKVGLKELWTLTWHRQ